jgi:hypothetical protein
MLRILLVLLSAALLIACGGSASSGSGGSAASSQEIPELNQQLIEERINDAAVWPVPPESGVGENIRWHFDEDEPKEITVVERQDNGNTVIMILDIKTQSAPRSVNMRVLGGRIRTEWRLETGWVLRRWNIIETENISMKYRDLPKPSPTGASPGANASPAPKTSGQNQ